MNDAKILSDLIAMSRELGKPENDYVILGEGNTSAKVDDNFFYVKASGKYLRDSDENTFLKVKLPEAVAILDKGQLNDDQIKAELANACADTSNPLRPSIETTFHAYLLSLPGVNFIGHTHATAVNAVTCSNSAEALVSGRVCPDEIVYCGIEPIFMEYSDPGLQLGRQIRKKVIEYSQRNGCRPKVILVRNHGIIAIGANAIEVEAITAMYCKTCRILAGAAHFGGVHFMAQCDVDRIYTRPDEDQRKRQFAVPE